LAEGRAKLSKGDVFGRWTLTKYIDTGGNGDVWFVESGDEEAAIKILHRPGKIDYERFRREVKICSEIDASVIAILPVLDHHLPDRPTNEDRAWFVMPRAIQLMEALEDSDLDNRVEDIRDVTSVLVGLLAWRGLNHRDVKPENLFDFEDRVVVGDLGLAKAPDDPNLTDDGKLVGPFHHLAPELVAGDVDVDWEKVDVYYVATSLWRLALGRRYPARGHISANDADSLARLLPDEPRIVDLARVIDRATSRSPAGRPTLRQLEAQLNEWLDARRYLAETESRKFEFTARHEQTEVRNRVVLEWLITEVRTKPAFGALGYEVEDPEKPSEEIRGLTEGEIGKALADLIELGYITGDPGLVFARKEPRYFHHLYPTPHGVEQVADVDDLLAEAVPMLEAFVDPVDGVSLPSDVVPVEVVPGLMRTPAEAYFQMWLLRYFDLLSFQPLSETGSSVTFMNVHATAPGKRWLYELARTETGGTA
jgi:hypothetical protein